MPFLCGFSVIKALNAPLFRRKESVRDGKIRRYIDQICFFYQKEGDNRIALAAKGGRMQGASLPQEVLERFARAKISDPFFCGKIRQMLKEGEEKWENG